jgi:membrane-bound metal-dependent hydrolase YbcI (DUF457 family)
MDPLTHIVIGRAVVAAARPESRARSVGAAAILGALAPDADSALVFAGWDRYVRAHQFGTHSLLGAAAMAMLAAFTIDRATRLLTRRANTRRYRFLFAAATAGAISHIALDLLSGARIAVGWPLVERRVSLPLMAMADPWFVAMCVGWLVLLWPARIRVGHASRALIAVATVFLCAKAALFSTAISRSPINLQAPTAFDARWGSFTEWFVFERLAGAVRASTISAKGGPPAVLVAPPLGEDTALVHASRGLDDVQNFLAVHEFAFADETRGGDGGNAVFWSDVRYCWPAAPGEPWRPDVDCAVHIGGVFDAGGRATMQEIRVGGFVQRRPP